MFKKIISIVPVAALLTVGATAQAATITVQKGDTLWDLARANNTSVEAIQTVNHLNTDLIYPGDLLTITQEKQYIVKLGDTLWDIAIDHNVTVSQIKDWNNLQTDLIHPGLNLLIYQGAKAASEGGKSSATNVQDSKESVPEVSVPSTGNTASKEESIHADAQKSNNTQEVETPKVTAPAQSTPQSKEEAVAQSSNKEAAKENAPVAEAPTKSDSTSKEIIVEATAYTASCEGCSGITSTGINLLENPDAKVISVDPTVIPLGSKVYVEGYGEAIAGDTGGGIKGNKIDVFIASKEDAINFGVKQLKVKILD
ncbi:3D domain-containing protein [Lysinibacillus sp. SGAir0095]|uniref:3D domain-containing protein n=1 Tax=Lysinibacillus sp. SGAir0095 TaxID=2070463 RepID=UPI0010CD695A|nr:3D domain-containing protein [Lysinibacillus sp. SGAir0095]QCR33855.1 peptidoglycan-binding protein [Lysinibacillus sp. SGAir0095]